MQLNKIGAIVSFILTTQFVLTLLWILVAWPEEGLGSLTDAMSEYFRERIDQPFEFALLNLYNVSFALTATALVVILRRLFSEYKLLGDYLIVQITVAASMYVASGVVPLVAAPGLLEIGDESALNAIEGIGAGLLLGATMASGFAVITFSIIGFHSGRIPKLLAAVALAAGIIELIEWAVPAILIMDPLLGTVWSVWLGVLFLQDKVGPPATANA